MSIGQCSMKISVIVPTYKPGKYLWDCLDALYNQTLDKTLYEVVLVLNGCKDPYHTYILQWQNSHSDMNLVYVQTDKGGVSNARNIALNLVSGEYVTFLDDDDFFSKETLARLYEKANPQCVTIFKPLAFYDNTNHFFEYSRTKEYYDNCTKDKVPFYQVRKNFSGPVMKLFPYSIIGNRRYDLTFKNGEDSLFMFLISDRMTEVNFADEDAIYYRRIRNNSAVTSAKSFMIVLKNSCRLIWIYSMIFFSNTKDYNFYFYITRVLGSIKAVLNYKKETY